MTDRVKRYLEIGKYFNSDFHEKHPEELHKYGQEGIKLREEMTIEELESLKSYLPRKQFNMEIWHWIEKKKAQQPENPLYEGKGEEE